MKPFSCYIPGSHVGRLSLLTAAVIGINAAALSTATADEEELPTVTVTGEKIVRTATETVTGAAVFTEEEVAEQTETTVLEVVQQIPNTTIGGYGGILNIRGVDGNGGGRSSYTWVGATRARTGTNIDGVSQIWTGGNVLDNGLWDVEQIEVLSGPQSTSQGRSAIGGAVVINSKDPTFDNEAAIRIGAEQANEKYKYQTAAMVSGGLTDTLAYRLSGDFVAGEHYINYIDNVDGYDYNTDPDDIENLDLKAKLLWLPEALPDLVARFDVQYQSQTGPYIDSVIYGDDGDYDAPMAVDADGNYDSTVSADAVEDRAQPETTAVNHRITDTSMTSYIANFEYGISNDVLATLVSSYSVLDNTYYHNQAGNSFTLDNWEQQTYNVEGRLNFDEGSNGLSGMIGTSAIIDTQDMYIYYLDENDEYDGDLFEGETSTQTFSLFGEAEYALTERLDIYAGGRIENEAQDRDAYWLGEYTGLEDSETDGTYLLPKAGARFAVTENSIVGIDVRRGYNPGGLAWDRNRRDDTAGETAYVYDAEYVTAIEVSSKNLFLDKRVSVNLNSFYNMYEDYQAYAGAGVEFGDGSVGGGITNVDEAVTFGAEFVAKARLTPRAEIFINTSTLQTEVVKYSADETWEGNALPFAPEYSVGFGADYGFTEAFAAGFSVKYVAEYYDDLDNTAGEEEGSHVVGDYTLVNLNATYAIGSAQLKAYVNNATNTYVVTAAGDGTQNVSSPRTIGLTFDYKF